LANAEIEEWLNTFQGVSMNPDGHYGLQCVDLANQYAMDIFGIGPRVAMTAVTGARQLLDAASDAYFVRINDAEGIYPQRGDIVVFKGSAINQWGHVCVCLEAHPNGMWVAQQDGFAPPLAWADGAWYSNKPAHKAWLAYNSNGTGPVSGWLRPRENKIVGYKAPAAPPASVTTNQRITGPDGVTRRSEPKVSASVVDTFGGDLVLTLGGYVHGESVTRNGFTSDVWFKGGLSGGYMWSGGFTSQSLAGLKDLAPKPAPAPAPKPVPAPVPVPAAKPVRVTVADGVNRRKAADAKAELIDTFGGDLELTIGGFVHSSSANSTPYNDGNNVWFVGGISGGYMHSSGFTNSSTQGLADLTGTEPKVPVSTVPVPEVKPYSFTKDFDFVEYIPANITNVNVGDFPAKPAKDVIHQMGTPGVDTITSTINEFKKAGTFKSAHFAVSGDRIVQMVSLKDRAYHAKTEGNVFIGIETDPLQDAKTIASVRKLLLAINDKYGYKLELTRHNEIPGNATSCGTLIDLEDYRVEWPSKPVVVPPVVVPPVVTPPSFEGDVIRQFLEWLVQSFLTRKK
jgi:hypothetical protein